MKQFIKLCNFLQYAMLIAATISVIVLQFVTQIFEFSVVSCCLAFYSVGFTAAALVSTFNCIEIYAASRRVKKAAYAELSASSSVEIISPKKERVKSVLQAIITFAFALFAWATLIGYEVKAFTVI